MAAAGVTFANVGFTLPDGRELLQNVCVEVAAGTTTALLGRSGSGKTTLLRTVNGLVRTSAGQVLVDGKDVAAQDVIALRRGIGYVIQESGLFPHMTVDRNIGMALELAGAPRPQIAARAAEVLKLVGLSPDLAQRSPWQLSGGQRQRVGFARALAADPAVLLMDEPFGALDPLTRTEMQDMLRDLLRRVRKTVLLVTHDLNEALFLASRIVFLEAGRVVANLPAEDVLGSKNDHVKGYVAAVRR